MSVMDKSETNAPGLCASPLGGREEVCMHAPEPPPAPLDGEHRLLPEVFSAENWALAERLGFPPSSNLEIRAAERSAEPLMRAAVQRCEKHWQSYAGGLPLLAAATTKVTNFMRHAVWHYGIPSHLRSVIWLTLSGVAVKMDENRGFCRALLKRHGYMQGEYAETIEKDLRRTFPEHQYFAQHGGVGIQKARNVLHALCWRNPLLNYCQSFNYLVAFLLLVIDDEESTFWIMCHLLENLLPNDLYSESLIGTKVDQIVLQELVRERLPRLAQQFSQLRFEVGTLISAWVMVLFINVFPIGTVMRLWDCLLDGSAHSSEPSCLPLEVVLAVLKMCQQDLLRCGDAGDVTMHLDHTARRLFDAEKLVRLVKEMRLSPRTVERLRRSARPLVVEEHHRRQKRLENHRLTASLQAKINKKGENENGNVTTGEQLRLHDRRFSGGHHMSPSASPTELPQRKYRDCFAGTRLHDDIAVSAWRRVEEEDHRREGVRRKNGDSAGLTSDGALPGRRQSREDSIGLEMESIYATSRDREEEVEHR